MKQPERYYNHARDYLQAWGTHRIFSLRQDVRSFLRVLALH